MRVLLPIPDRDFDVTEVAVPWRILRDAGHEVVFATERSRLLPSSIYLPRVAADPVGPLRPWGHCQASRAV